VTTSPSASRSRARVAENTFTTFTLSAFRDASPVPDATASSTLSFTIESRHRNVRPPLEGLAIYGRLGIPADVDFVEVATTYGNFNACAIRTAGTVTCWNGLATMPPLGPTPSGTFTHLAGCEAAMCGIRTDGTTVCWQPAGVEPLVPPAGW